mmetsp:Transcript_48888/g.81145  ORF Transcript_48888/g.81145 Transcript_48888/m.81145 type:complete len:278 (+) Transcript_48888:261-1094(+)
MLGTNALSFLLANIYSTSTSTPFASSSTFNVCIDCPRARFNTSGSLASSSSSSLSEDLGVEEIGVVAMASFKVCGFLVLRPLGVAERVDPGRGERVRAEERGERGTGEAVGVIRACTDDLFLLLLLLLFVSDLFPNAAARLRFVPPGVLLPPLSLFFLLFLRFVSRFSVARRFRLNVGVPGLVGVSNRDADFFFFLPPPPPTSLNIEILIGLIFSRSAFSVFLAPPSFFFLPVLFFLTTTSLASVLSVVSAAVTVTAAADFSLSSLETVVAMVCAAD